MSPRVFSVIMLSHKTASSVTISAIAPQPSFFSFESVERDIGCVCSYVGCCKHKAFKALTALSPGSSLGLCSHE